MSKTISGHLFVVFSRTNCKVENIKDCIEKSFEHTSSDEPDSFDALEDKDQGIANCLSSTGHTVFEFKFAEDLHKQFNLVTFLNELERITGVRTAMIIEDIQYGEPIGLHVSTKSNMHDIAEIIGYVQNEVNSEFKKLL